MFFRLLLVGHEACLKVLEWPTAQILTTVGGGNNSFIPVIQPSNIITAVYDIIMLISVSFAPGAILSTLDILVHLFLLRVV